MADWNHSFDYFAFTPEEKEQLTDRLRQAAEQEERMKEPTKRIIRHTGRQLLIGAGAAAALTMGTLAATVGAACWAIFEARTPRIRGSGGWHLPAGPQRKLERLDGGPHRLCRG